MSDKICSIEGCNNKYRCKGYCNKHYQQYLKYGHPLKRSRKDLNEIIEYEDYAEIILYNGDSEEIARTIIDLEDIELIKNIKWCLNCKGYAYNKRHGFLHRIVTNCPNDMIVDHINHNILDNRKCNLRVCTNSQNNMNTNVRCDNKLGIKGVCLVGEKYFAQINYKGKKIHIGIFNTLEEAKEAYNQKANELFGEFSYENSKKISNNIKESDK